MEKVQGCTYCGKDMFACDFSQLGVLVIQEAAAAQKYSDVCQWFYEASSGI